MDDRRFDALTKQWSTSRRDLIKKFLGLGGAVAATTMLAEDAGAARRGYAGPMAPTSSNGGTFDICSAANPFCCATCFNPDRDYAQRTLDQCTRRGLYPCDYCAAMAMCVVKPT